MEVSVNTTGPASIALRLVRPTLAAVFVPRAGSAPRGESPGDTVSFSPQARRIADLVKQRSAGLDPDGAGSSAAAYGLQVQQRIRALLGGGTAQKVAPVAASQPTVFGPGLFGNTAPTSPTASDPDSPGGVEPTTSPTASDPGSPDGVEPTTSPTASDPGSPGGVEPTTSPTASDPGSPDGVEPTTSPTASDPGSPDGAEPTTSPTASGSDSPDGAEPTTSPRVFAPTSLPRGGGFDFTA